MFERQYVLRSFAWLGLGASLNDQINEAVRACDHERAPASIACMTSDGNQVHILIEQWRDCGDTEQDAAGSVDVPAKDRKPRRARTTQDDHARAAERVESEGLDLPLEPSSVGGQSA